MGKCIGIVGSRRRDTAEDFRKCLAAFKGVYKPGDTIVSGGCPRGADRFAEMIAKKDQVTITIHYAAWDRQGRSAGPIRNKLIARDADVLVALVADDRTGGTESAVAEAERLGKRVILA